MEELPPVPTCAVCASPDITWTCAHEHCGLQLCCVHYTQYELSESDARLFNFGDDALTVLSDLESLGLRTICKQCVFPCMIEKLKAAA